MYVCGGVRRVWVMWVKVKIGTNCVCSYIWELASLKHKFQFHCKHVHTVSMYTRTPWTNSLKLRWGLLRGSVNLCEGRTLGSTNCCYSCINSHVSCPVTPHRAACSVTEGCRCRILNWQRYQQLNGRHVFGVMCSWPSSKEKNSRKPSPIKPFNQNIHLMICY